MKRAETMNGPAQAFPSLGANIDKALLVILAFTVVPIVWELWQRRKHRGQRRSAERVPD